MTVWKPGLWGGLRPHEISVGSVGIIMQVQSQEALQKLQGPFRVGGQACAP